MFGKQRYNSIDSLVNEHSKKKHSTFIFPKKGVSILMDYLYFYDSFAIMLFCNSLDILLFCHAQEKCYVAIIVTPFLHPLLFMVRGL